MYVYLRYKATLSATLTLYFDYYRLDPYKFDSSNAALRSVGYLIR